MWFKSSWFLLHTALFITSNVVLGTPNEVASEQYDKTLPGLGVAYRANRRAQPWSNETISASLSAHEPTPVESTLVDSSTSLTSVNNPQTPHSRPEPSQANGATTVTADQSSSFASVSSATDVVSGTQASSRHSSGPSSSSSSTSTQHDVASSQIPSPSSRMSTVLPSQTKGSQTTTAFSTYGGTTLGLGSSNAATSTPESQLVSDVSSTLQVSQSSSSVVERQSSSTATTHRSSISEPTPSSSMAPEPSSATEQTPDSSFHQASTVTLEATSDNVASSITTNNGNSVGSTSPTSLAASNTMHQTGWSSAKTSLSSFGVPSSSGYAPGSTGPQSDTAFPTSTVSATSTDSPDHSHTSWNAPSGISTTSISSSVIGQSSGRSSSSISLTIPSTLSQISSGFIATTLYSGSSPLTSNVLSVTVVFSVTINSITISTAESLTSFVNTGSQLPPQSQNPVPSSFFIPVSETLAVPPSVATSLTSLLTGISLPGMTSGTGQPSQPSDESTIISAQSSLRTTPPSQSSQVVPTTTPSASNSTTSSTTEILSSQGSVSSDSTLGFSPSDSTTLLDGTSTAGSSTATVLLPSTGGTAATGVSETSLVSTQGSQPIPTSETLLLSTTLPTGLPLKSSLIISDAPGLSTGNSISSLASVTFPIGTGATAILPRL
ncbi:hypothetical protein K491DRAFT_167894 [Lophiostoma macrostomum CBS 122681]|uniref:REJ domain-containing protein n=1 Tax=Lophiostoma macrostomum CBS 122681 TaxID=1314788 RepID=A0A6A6STR4_9PLEO|nr:hypothetical protein K491DRAFT_167894 [Lophiostoma macrostomum CBS 122681]